MKGKAIDLKSRMETFAQKGQWQSVIVKVISSDLFWLLIACGIFRLIYCFPFDPSIVTDSDTYLNFDANILLGQVDMFRTPVYPYFIKLIKLFGVENLIQNIIIVQSIISFLTIIIFYKIVRIVFKNRTVILMATLIYGIMPSITNFDQSILTESLSITAIVLFLYFIVSYLKNPTILKAVLFTMYIFFLIMLRPSFIFLLPIMIVFWALRIIYCKTEWKMGLSGLAASIVCVLLIAGYSRLNYSINGCNSITAVSKSNQLDIIINANIYLDGNDPEISETIKSNLSEQPEIYYVNLKNILFARFSQTRISKFVTSCIVNHPTIYLYQVVEKIYKLSKETTTVNAAKKDGYLGKLALLISNIISIPFIIIFQLLTIDFIYIIVRWVKSKQLPWFKMAIWSIIAAHFVTIIIGAQSEYHRLFVLALPYVIVLLFSYIDILFYSIDKDKLSKYSTFAFDNKQFTRNIR